MNSLLSIIEEINEKEVRQGGISKKLKTHGFLKVPDINEPDYVTRKNTEFQESSHLALEKEEVARKKIGRSMHQQNRKSIATEGGVYKILDVPKENIKSSSSRKSLNPNMINGGKHPPSFGNFYSEAKNTLKTIEEKDTPNSPPKEKPVYNSSKERNSFNFNMEGDKETRNQILTIEQVVQDINKSYLSFNKRLSDQGPVRGFQKMGNFIKARKMFKVGGKMQNSNINYGIQNNKLNNNQEYNTNNNSFSTENKLISLKESEINEVDSEGSSMDNKSSIKFSSTFKIIEKTDNDKLNFKENKTIKEIVEKKGIKKKFENVYNVITTVLFIRREIIKFGVPPREFSAFDTDGNSERTISLNTGRKTFKNLDEIIRNKDSRRKQNIPCYMISPLNSCNFYWTVFICLVMVYTSIVMPFRLSFTDNYLNPQSSIFPFDLGIEFVFILDILKTLITPYNNEEGKMVTNLGKIFLNYLNGWLFLDVISIFPFYLINSFNMMENQTSGNSLFILFRLPKLYKFVRLVKVLKLANIIKSHQLVQQLETNLSINRGILKLLTFFVTIGFICHIFACIWFYTAKLDDFEPDTWVVRNELRDSNIYFIYLNALYFSFTTFVTVGYGDITAKTNMEIILIIFWVFSAGIYYSFSISNLGNIFAGFNAKLIEMNKKALIVAEIAKNNGFSKSLEDKIKNYNYKTTMKEETNDDYKSILSELPTVLKYKIAKNIFEGRISQIHIFNDASKDFIANIIPLLLYEFKEVKKTFYHYDEIPENVFFLLSGEAIFLTIDNIIFLRVKAGSYFGEIEIIKKTYRDATAMANTTCEVLTMTRQLLLENISHNHMDFFNDLIHNMIERYNFQVNVIKTIEKVIEDGIQIYFSVHHDIEQKSELNNKDFFNIGIKTRVETIKEFNGSQSESVDLDLVQKEKELNRCKLKHISSKALDRKEYNSYTSSLKKVVIEEEVKENENENEKINNFDEVIDEFSPTVKVDEANGISLLLKEIHDLKEGNKSLSQKMDRILSHLDHPVEEMEEIQFPSLINKHTENRRKSTAGRGKTTIFKSKKTLSKIIPSTKELGRTQPLKRFKMTLNELFRKKFNEDSLSPRKADYNLIDNLCELNQI